MNILQSLLILFFLPYLWTKANNLVVFQDNPVGHLGVLLHAASQHEHLLCQLLLLLVVVLDDSIQVLSVPLHLCRNSPVPQPICFIWKCVATVSIQYDCVAECRSNFKIKEYYLPKAFTLVIYMYAHWNTYIAGLEQSSPTTNLLLLC